jgi:CheY-like chemotaxis protein
MFQRVAKYVTLCAIESKREVRNVPSVLIADDDAGLRGALKLALEANGYEVRLAANGNEALALQRKSPADILITDIFMPESDGFETIDGFRKSSPATKIIAMSGDAKRAKREYLSAAALIGVDATLKKPFRVGALLQVLRSLGV